MAATLKAPTPEQSEVISYISAALAKKIKETVGIKAYAGTGKTSTLFEVIIKNPNTLFLYIAFNSSAAKDFSEKLESLGVTNCVVKTVHALAFFYTKPKNPRGDYKAAEISDILGVSYQDAEKCRTAFSFYCNSNFNNVKQMPISEKEKMMVELLYEKMESGKISQTHSFYLKKFSKMLKDGSTVLDKYECVLLDEAQDTNPTAMSVFKSIKSFKVFVGDSHQSIYGFNGAVNAMDKISAAKTFSLTVNFRSVPKIIAKANDVLRIFKNETNEIIPLIKEGSAISVKAYIARLNGTIVDLIRNNDTFCLIRSPDVIFAPSLAIYYWDRGEDNLIPKEYSFIKKFPNRDKIFSYIEETGDKELELAIKLVEEEAKKGGSIFDVYEKAKNNNNINANKVFSTAHTAKGLEFDEAEICSDFPNLLDILDEVVEEKKSFREFEEEANLYYVAITRAKYILTDNGKSAGLLDHSEQRWVAERVRRITDAIEAKKNNPAEEKK